MESGLFEGPDHQVRAWKAEGSGVPQEDLKPISGSGDPFSTYRHFFSVDISQSLDLVLGVSQLKFVDFLESGVAQGRCCGFT